MLRKLETLKKTLHPKYGSTFGDCPMCGADEFELTMELQERDISCTVCGTEWSCGEKDRNGSYEYEVVTCPPDPDRVGTVRSGYEWSEMEGDTKTEGIYESEPRFSVSEDANPLKTFSFGLVLLGLGGFLLTTVVLFPIGVLLILAGIVMLPLAIGQWFYKPTPTEA